MNYVSALVFARRACRATAIDHTPCSNSVPGAALNRDTEIVGVDFQATTIFMQHIAAPEDREFFLKAMTSTSYCLIIVSILSSCIHNSTTHNCLPLTHHHHHHHVVSSLYFLSHCASTITPFFPMLILRRCARTQQDSQAEDSKSRSIEK